MGNTVQLVAGSILLALISGTILALLLNRPIWGRSALRGIATVPFLVTPSVMALIWKNLFLSPSSGMVNWLLHFIGIPPVAWFSTFPLQSIIFIVAWEWTPFVMLVISQVSSPFQAKCEKLRRWMVRMLSQHSGVSSFPYCENRTRSQSSSELFLSFRRSVKSI